MSDETQPVEQASSPFAETVQMFLKNHAAVVALVVLTGIVIGLQKDKDVDTIGQELRVADVPVAEACQLRSRAMAAVARKARSSPNLFLNRSRRQCPALRPPNARVATQFPEMSRSSLASRRRRPATNRAL